MSDFEQQVEKVARAICDDDIYAILWANLDENDRNKFRSESRAALAALGITDTAPAPAISGGENALDRIVAELKWIVAHAGFPRSRGEIVDRAKFALALAAADRSAS